MDQTQLIGIVSLIVSSTGLLGYLVKLNHKRLRSTCCNITCIASVDLEETTPPAKITIPESKDGSSYSSA